MTYGTYLAGRDIAPRLRARFARHFEAARHSGAPETLAPLPETEAIEALIEAAFWTSLRREEAYVPKVSLALLPVSATSHPLVFDRPLPLLPATLARVAPAVERPGIHLGVWYDAENALAVWGTTR